MSLTYNSCVKRSQPTSSSDPRSPTTTPWIAQFPLTGPGGEPIDLARTFQSHGVASLPPMRTDEAAGIFEVTLSAQYAGSHTVRVFAESPGYGVVSIAGNPPEREGETLFAAVR